MPGGYRIVRTPFPEYVSTKKQAFEWVCRFYETAETAGIGFDTETTGLHVINDRIKFFSLAQKDYRICAPIRLLHCFRDLLEDPDVPKRLTNTKYDQHLAANHGIILRGPCQDTADQDFLLDENRQGRHGLKQCARDYLGLRMTPFKQLFGDVGSIEKEIETLCEVHSILEQYDHDGETEEAEARATRVMVRLKQVDADKSVIKDVKRLEVGIRSGYTLDRKKLLKIARDHGFANMTRGKGGYISDFVEFLGGGKLESQEARQSWAHLLEDPDVLEDFHEMLWSKMVSLIDAGGDPIERLRLMVADYASLDAWASYMLVDELREALTDEDMVVEDQEDLYDAFELPILILKDALREETEKNARATLKTHLAMTKAKRQNVSDRIAEGWTAPTMLECSEYDRVPFLRTLWNMERRGFKIQVDECEHYAVEMQAEIDRIERDIVKETGDLDFNPDSHPQVRDHLFCRGKNGKWEDPWGNPPKKMTSGGESSTKLPSTSKEVLEEFAGKGHTLSRKILDRRRNSKLKSTYMEALPRWADRNERIHTNLKSTGAVTWRLSSSGPNLQNIPARDPVWGTRIRRLFIAGQWGDCDPSWCLPEVEHVSVPDLPASQPMTLIVADYKQLEMRIMAHFSRDEGMIEAILKGRDMHCQTVSLASEIGAIERGITYDIAFAAKKAANPTADQLLLLGHRSNLKATGFGIIYGIGALKLGMQLGLAIVPRKARNGRVYDTCPEAQKLIDDYLTGIYPGVGEFIKFTHKQCYDDMVVYTIAGHPRRLPDIRSRDRGRAAQAQRQSVNSRVQGSAADITNKAMLLCEGDPVLRSLGVRLLLQIHDELVFEVPDDPKFIEPAKQRIKELMEDPYDMLVPIEIDMDVAYAWGEAK